MGTSEGVLFRVTPSGAFTVLHTFDSLTEGPSGLGLTQASDGNFYGTTVGAETIFTTLFRLTHAGQFTILHSFHYSDFPTSAPLQGLDGRLYGIRSGGTFNSNLAGTDLQESPIANLFAKYITQTSDSNLWSVTFSDTDFPNGALRTISTGGTLLQTLALDGPNGSEPNAPVLQASDGKLWGVTYTGGTVPQGSTPGGVIFTINAGLAPPLPAIVSFSPSAAAVGTQVRIHGSHFVATSTVSFNGVAAKFRVLNTGNIAATVPAGATTGPI